MPILSRRPRWTSAILAVVPVVALGGPALLHAQSAAHAPATRTEAVPAPPSPAAPVPQVAVVPAAPPTAAAADALQLGQAFTDVAERTLPSVVSIHVEAEAEEEDGPQMPPGFMNPFMPPGGGNGGGGRGGNVVHGSGSGVIIRQDGVILTNNHVVERARRISVHLRDGRSFRARVLGTDPAVDLALVRIEADHLPVARLGDSDAARVGEFVLAIGAPLGLEATVTHGVVSATGRSGLGANDIEDYLQTDASINPGNSGGPLVNLRGEVLGINTMIIGRNTGIGMAVPSRLAQSVVEQILRNGRVARGWVGVGVQDLSPELAGTMGIPASAHGAVVNQVEPNAPAARAGLALGDVVTAVDGVAITSSHDLVRSITRHGVNDRLAMSILRAGHAQTLTVTTSPRPGQERVAANEPEGANGANEGGAGAPMMGLRLAVLTPELAARMGAPQSGVMIAGVLPGSAADEAGLRRGDLIMRADGHEVHGLTDVQNEVRDHQVNFLVRRGNAQMFVPVVRD